VLVTGNQVQISEEERGVLKTNIVQIMLTAPKPIQSQLGEALSIISRHDFPAKWPNLIPVRHACSVVKKGMRGEAVAVH